MEFKKEQIIGFLTEFNTNLEDEACQLKADKIFDSESKSLNKDIVGTWKKMVEEKSERLAFKWFEVEEFDVNTYLQTWAGEYYDDNEFVFIIREICGKFESWKKTLREVLSKDPSVYTIPPELLAKSDTQILEQTDEESSLSEYGEPPSKSEEEIKDDLLNVDNEF